MRRLICVGVFLSLFVASNTACTKTVRLGVMRPAKMDIKGIESVIVLPFEEVGTVKNMGSAAKVRSRVIKNLIAGKQLEVIEAKSRTSIRGKKADGIIGGKVWWSEEKSAGVTPGFYTTVTKGINPDGILATMATQDHQTTVPYRMQRTMLKTELTLTRIGASSDETVTTSTDYESQVDRTAGSGRNPKTGPILDGMVPNVAKSFTQRISPYEVQIDVELEKANSRATELMMLGVKNPKFPKNFKDAIKLLQADLATLEGEARAPTLYDLGLCYEALGKLGDIEQALIHYEEAALLTGKDNHCRALARATQVRDDIIRLTQQTQMKSKKN